VRSIAPIVARNDHGNAGKVNAGQGTLQNGLYRRFPAMTCIYNAHQPRPFGLVGELTHFFYGKIFDDDRWRLFVNNHLPPEWEVTLC
jgi:hypothetical protein